MPTDEYLRQTLEHYRGQERKLVEDLRSVRLMLRQIERDLGIESSDPGDEVLGTPSASGAGSTLAASSAGGGKPNIRPDEFFGLTHAEAARRYLKRVGHAVALDELVDALQKGGCKVGGAAPKKVLYISLVRNTRDFVPPQTGYIGLREFYGTPERPLRDSKPTTAKKARRPKPGRQRKAATFGDKRAAVKPQPNQLAIAVRAVMSDKQPRLAEDIIGAVRQKLGRDVQKIGVFGVLSNRRTFEKTDGRYRLIG